ncbi:MAG: N-acetylmuramoyl-L-alanine amidase [Clostridia bacterium]|nr:N-acetylmuramoyl-L-alanine amidase [Clostridia bacterium]
MYKNKSTKKKLFLLVGLVSVILVCGFIYFTVRNDVGTKPRKVSKVCIDAGHGGYDSGAVGIKGLKEKEVNLKVALLLGKILEENQIEVVYTRASDEVTWPSVVNEDLKARCKISNEADADVFISIHCNSSDDSKVRGVETWCKDSDPWAKKLANKLQSQLASAKLTSDRGIKHDTETHLYVLRKNNALPVLVELGFLSNAEDSAFLGSDTGQKICAEALSRGVMEFKAEVE